MGQAQESTQPKRKIFDGKYEILSIVGRGSRSVVYQAKNITDNNEEVALKVLIQNKKDKSPLSEKLRREALALVSSHHPSVIRLDDFHSIGEICYLAMEYAKHADLRKYMASIGQKLSVDLCEKFLTQVADGLDYIHRTGIIHRDIKPDNLLITADKQIRIADFGVAFLPGDQSEAGELKNAVGTMDYMAPEVLEGIEYTVKSDIYSLGVTIYEALTGKNPFSEVSMLEQFEVRKSLPPVKSIRAEVPDYLSEIIEKATAFKPQDRFSSAKELLQFLKQKRTIKQQVIQLEEPFKKISEARPQLKIVPDVVAEAKSEAIEATVQTIETEEQVQAEEMDQSIILRDSRASRTPTLFISKDSVDSMRVVSEKLSKTEKGYTASISNGKLLVIGLTVLLAIFVGKKFVLSSDDSLENADEQTVSISENVESLSSEASTTSTSTTPVLMPKFDGKSPIRFPNLPKGIYTGQATGVIGTTAMPISIISFAKKGRMAILLGADGMTPSVVEIPESAEADSIKVTANGYMIELSNVKINNDSSELEGTVKNIVTGTNGTFKIVPVNLNGAASAFKES